MQLWTTTQTEMVTTRGRQVRLTYDHNVRREDPAETWQKDLWLVEVRLLGTQLEPWLLITDWPVTDTESALRIFRMYRQRWAAEDSFKFTKDCLGWQNVQVLDLTAIRTPVALAWVAAGFLYELGVTLEWSEVCMLAKLGGWQERHDRPPGKIILTRGLQRLFDMLTTEAWLVNHIEQHGALLPRIAALLHGWSPPDLRADLRSRPCQRSDNRSG